MLILEKDNPMLYLFFTVLDVLTLLAYPVVFVIYHIRKMKGVK